VKHPSYDLFLSHNHAQKPWVRELVKFLRGLGFSVFFDEDSIAPGQDFLLAIERAVESSRAVVLVISRAALKSRWVTFEAALRLHEDPIGDTRLLIPMLTEPIARSELRPSIRRLDAVDLTHVDTREAEFLHFLRSLGLPEDQCRPLTSWPPPTGVEDLHVADINSVIAAEWTGIDLLERLIALDYEVFEELVPMHEGVPEQWAPVFMDHPETWRLLTNEAKEVVGYWHFVPLFDDDFACAIRGRLRDSEITADRVRLFELPGWYDIYFVSIALRARFRRPKVLIQMTRSLLEVLTDLARNGVFVRQVCANAYTPSGVGLCRSLGMAEVGRHEERGRIFLAPMSELLARLATEDSWVATRYSEAWATSGKHVVAAPPAETR
jgi:hypothetical protein